MVITRKTTKVTQWHENQEKKNKTRFTVVVNTVEYKRNVEKTEIGKNATGFDFWMSWWLKSVLVDDGLDYTRLKELMVSAIGKYLSWILAVKENRNEKLSTVQ